MLIVGSGLTAVDVALSLRDLGHAGTIRMVSSHGLLPEAHVREPLPTVPPFVTVGSPAAASVRATMAAVIAATRDAADWRQVVDGLRPQTVPLWRGLSETEQRRFLRHVARRWEVRRHRMAPEVAAAISALRSAGSLVIDRGRVTALTAVGDRIRATIASAGQGHEVLVDGVVLCTGPSADPGHDPLLARLMGQGLATRHPLGLGLAVDGDGRLMGPDGRTRQGLWAMGSLRKGAEWESTAVPELRLHARAIAAAILGEP